jgi:hypothetical protein
MYHGLLTLHQALSFVTFRKSKLRSGMLKANHKTSYEAVHFQVEKRKLETHITVKDDSNELHLD